MSTWGPSPSSPVLPKLLFPRNPSQVSLQEKSRGPGREEEGGRVLGGFEVNRRWSP